MTRKHVHDHIKALKEAHHKHRLLAAVTIAGGFVVAYYVFKEEWLLRGAEWSFVPWVDKILFGISE